MNQLNPQILKEIEIFSNFLEGITIIEGRKGSGKTLSAVAIAWKLKKYFNRPVVCDFQLKPEFGSFMYLDERRFISELKKITEIASADDEERDFFVEWALKKMEISLIESTIILDEAYRYFDCRNPMSMVNRIYGYFIDQSRHYKCSMFLLTPKRSRLDKRVLGQVDRLAKVTMNSYTQTINMRVLDYMTGETFRIRIYGPNYWDLYDSWAPVAMRKRALESLLVR